MNHWEANFREHPPKCTCVDCNDVRLAGGDNRLRRRRPDGDYEVDGYGRFWKINHPLLSSKVAAELEETLARVETEQPEKETRPTSSTAHVLTALLVIFVMGLAVVGIITLFGN